QRRAQWRLVFERQAHLFEESRSLGELQRSRRLFDHPVNKTGRVIDHLNRHRHAREHAQSCTKYFVSFYDASNRGDEQISLENSIDSDDTGCPILFVSVPLPKAAEMPKAPEMPLLRRESNHLGHDFFFLDELNVTPSAGLRHTNYYLARPRERCAAVSGE